MSNNQPIGMFDSGVGGLSVLAELHALRPTETILYYADNAYCPYGLRPPEEIRERSVAIARLLVEQGAKAIVVACNTASAMAIDHVRQQVPGVPFIGLEPAVKPGVAMTKSKNIGVLATPRTVSGERLRWLIETHGGDVKVHSVAAAGLVELVEAGILSGPRVDAALRPFLDPMIGAGVDVVVLGCTHYPYLRSAIQAYVGPEVAVIDSGTAIARRTQSVLDVAGLLSASFEPGTWSIQTSGDVAEVGPVAELLTGGPVAILHRDPKARTD
ncbi:MAG: glutamate racemase [Thermomicrobiales bacterium]